MSFWGNHHSIKKTTWYKISKVFQCHIMLMSLSTHQQTWAPNATALLRLVLLTCLGSDEDHNLDQRWLYSVARGKNKKKLDTFDKHCAWSLNFRAARIDRKGKQASEHSGARACESTLHPLQNQYGSRSFPVLHSVGWCGWESLWNLTAQSKSWLLHLLAVWPSENH